MNEFGQKNLNCFMYFRKIIDLNKIYTNQIKAILTFECVTNLDE